MRYQTVAVGESWAVHGRFISGRTITVSMFNGETGSSISLSSSACTEIGTTGIYRANSTQLSTNPTTLTSIVWQMTDSFSGVTDEGLIVVGGHVDDVSLLNSYIQGGRYIDFTGSDSLGWQRVERNLLGVEVRRYNLFDEAGSRITGTVADFLTAKKMISSEVLV